MCNATRSHSVLHDICDLSRKTRYTSNRYDFIKNKIFAKKFENAPSPCKNFRKKYIFCSMVLGVSTIQFWCETNKNSWRTNFLKIISFGKKTHGCTTLSRPSSINRCWCSLPNRKKIHFSGSPDICSLHCNTYERFIGKSIQKRRFNWIRLLFNHNFTSTFPNDR